MTKLECVVIDYDPDPDLSWLAMDREGSEEYRDAANHVTLEMLGYAELGAPVSEASLGNIDFLYADDNWCTGTFYRVCGIPARCDYLREVAREMGLPD